DAWVTTGATTPREEAWLLRSATRSSEQCDRKRNPRSTEVVRHYAYVSPRRYLCGGIRSVHALLLFDVRRRERATRERQTQDHDSRWRAEPARRGHRIRLLLRARGIRTSRARIRDDHGELESGDGFDRLRHE